MDDALHIFGIRHHGPGSARSLGRALNELKPDCVLLEGPPDAGDDLLALAAKETMQPPVAILVHASDEPSRAVYYPFASFSPEWIAIQWALTHKTPLRFMDLPMSHRMAIDRQREEQAKMALEAAAKAQASDEDDDADEAPHPAAAPSVPLLRRDPLGELAKAAGFDDGERWWEHAVELRGGDDATGVFDAIREAIAELWQSQEPLPREHEDSLREAWMRRTIRQAKQDGFKSIAIVCGAWHGPALDVDAVAKKDDDELLKGLLTIKTSATWVPWTHDRLCAASGYGAGVRSPGWYEHLFRHAHHTIESWLTRVARLLREKDIDCSSAHVIEAVRLSRTLAGMRARPIPDLADIADATRAVFCFDSDLPMQLIARELMIGNRLGEVPEETPLVPLQQDLIRLQKSLRLKPEALEKALELDLRNETDRNRSFLLHRLNLLSVPWGTREDRAAASKGTFKEAWTLRWDPGFVVPLIEAGALGNTLELAAAAKLRQRAAATNDLRALAALLDDALLAELGAAAADLVKQIENAAAVAADVALLMETLPRLARVMRYGNVRQADATMVREIINGIVPRVTVGLGVAVASLNDEAAQAMLGHVQATHAAIELVESEEHARDWNEALRRIADQPSVHGLIRGRCIRLLLDGAKIDRDEAFRQMSRTLSRGTEPAQAAHWLEGFLAGSGLLLVHDAKLLAMVDDWVTAINGDVFTELLPLLRRTFAAFEKPERRQIGQALIADRSTSASTTTIWADIDECRAARPLPLLLKILGGAE